MNLLEKIHLADTEEKCLRRARKRLDQEKKWGKWMPAISLAGAAAFLGVGVAFILIAFKMVAQFQQQLQQPPGQNAAPLGMAIGILLGFLAGSGFFKAAMQLAEFIKWLRGDLTYPLLLKYHDGLAALMSHEALQEAASAGPMPPSAVDLPPGS
jgi:sterol desaturase/sphingolipid hydroxylase (fatty acid hydroxylase superfamily)